MALPLIGTVVAIGAGTIKVTAAIAVITVTLLFIADWLKIFPDWLQHLVAGALKALFNLLADFAVFLFGAVLDLLIAILNGLDFDFAVFNPAAYITAAGADVVNMVALVRIPEALAIILAAITIRIVLSLIPFLRW